MRRAFESRPVRIGAALALVLAMGLGMRVMRWSEVFTADGTRFIRDTDPHYHVLRAWRILRGSPDGWWFDRNIDFPDGAEILWPPGWDLTLAGAALVVHGRDATPQQVERVAAWVPVVFGLAAIAAVWAMATLWLGATAGLVAALLAAVLPVHVEWGALGGPDHHIAEIVTLLASLLALERASGSTPPRRWAAWTAALALSLAAIHLVWQGAALHIAVLVLAVAALSILPGVDEGEARRAIRTLGWACVGAALALAATVAWARPPGALSPTALRGLSIFQPALLFAVATWTALLLPALRRATSWRARAAAIVATGVLQLALLGLCFGEPIRHGLHSFAVTDPLWKTIAEDQPLLLSPYRTLRTELLSILRWYGPALLAPVAAIPALVRRWRESPGSTRVSLVVLSVATAFFLGATIRSIRFRYYLSPFLAIAAAAVVVDVVERLRRRARRGPAIAAGVALVALFASPAPAWPRAAWGGPTEDSIHLVQWVGAQNPAGHAILAPWDLGHAIQYFAGAPVVATPFGSDVGEGGLRDLATFLYARDEDEAMAVVLRRRARFVLVEEPGRSIVLAPFAPAPAPGPGTAPPFAARLYDRDGSGEGEPGGLGVGRLRLVAESWAPVLKVFEAVPGARLRVDGAPTGAQVTAFAEVRSNMGRRFRWTTAATADASGRAELVVPFSSGDHLDVLVTPFRVTAAEVASEIAVPEAAVVEGAAITVRLEP